MRYTVIVQQKLQLNFQIWQQLKGYSSKSHRSVKKVHGSSNGDFALFLQHHYSLHQASSKNFNTFCCLKNVVYEQAKETSTKGNKVKGHDLDWWKFQTIVRRWRWQANEALWNPTFCIQCTTKLITDLTSFHKCFFNQSCDYSKC